MKYIFHSRMWTYFVFLAIRFLVLFLYIYKYVRTYIILWNKCLVIYLNFLHLLFISHLHVVLLYSDGTDYNTYVWYAVFSVLYC